VFFPDTPLHLGPTLLWFGYAALAAGVSAVIVAGKLLLAFDLYIIFNEA